MANFDFELNREGVRELLRSDEMMDVCSEYASASLSRLGTGYTMDTHRGKNRVNAQVTAETWEARHENAKSNSILKSLRG
ncbi:MAG: hypothetical protein IIZ78_28995 [Clostridiales bacterium]|nr:hypothetical protein [Clostridiales bacterium]